MLSLSILIIFIIILFYGYTSQKKFGSLPDNISKLKIEKSKNFRDGAFQNLSYTPNLTEGVSFFDALKDFLFSKKERLKPIDALPSLKTDLLNLPKDQNVFIWFGHSSYFMQIDGKRFLVDPVFSGSASPIPGTVKAFAGSDIYTADDIPEIDYLFISHDHWDHLDYDTFIALKPKINKIICGLGVGSHLRYWGFEKEIIETDWYDHTDLGDGFNVITTPARHFSGRSFKRNQSLWASFVLNTPSKRIFIGGDSGYDTHFSKIGALYGPFDLAIIENGQYNWKWKHIHTLPEETVQVAKDLKAKAFIPVHSSKFALAMHSWDEPLQKVNELSKKENLNIITPRIGEPVLVDQKSNSYQGWWHQVR